METGCIRSWASPAVVTRSEILVETSSSSKRDERKHCFGSTAIKGFDDLRREMIIKAAELGGDALILGPEPKKTGVIFVPTPIFFDKKKLTGEVIAFNR